MFLCATKVGQMWIPRCTIGEKIRVGVQPLLAFSCAHDWRLRGLNAQSVSAYLKLAAYVVRPLLVK